VSLPEYRFSLSLIPQAPEDQARRLDFATPADS
jgi:hypothetical protein